MLPLLKILKYEREVIHPSPRVPEPVTVMNDHQQIESYVDSYRWGGPASALLLYHIVNVSHLIRPGDRVIDLACGPGPLLLELARLYPETQFVGVDLAPNMLEYVKFKAQSLKLQNVTTRAEDICNTPSFANQSVDLIISTSSLHHLPTEDDLKSTIRNCARILKADGAVYLFDFGLLKNRKTRNLMVDEIRGVAGEITVEDYRMSLDAAFPIDTVRKCVQELLGSQVKFEQSRLATFFYFVRSRKRSTIPLRRWGYFLKLFFTFPFKYKIEFLMLFLFKRQVVS